MTQDFPLEFTIINSNTRFKRAVLFEFIEIRRLGNIASFVIEIDFASVHQAESESDRCLVFRLPFIQLNPFHNTHFYRCANLSILHNKTKFE